MSAANQDRPQRRMGVQGSQTWSLLLDTAERLMRDKGYAAVTSRRLAQEAGLSSPSVHFYFRSMDELFEAMFKRLAASILQSVDEAKTADNPILALWEVSCDGSRAGVMAELLSLSNHRKGLQSAIGEFGEEYNRRQSEIIAAQLDGGAFDLDQWPPIVLASLLDNLGKGFSFAQGYNIAGHSRAQQIITELIRSLAPARPAG